MLPGQSSRPLRRSPSSCRDLYDQIMPSTPIGTLTQNTARQCHSASRPPSTRPMNEPAIAATWLMPSAMPRWRAGNASVRIAVELAKIMPPPTPCTTRQAISHMAPEPAVSGSRESAIEATEKTTKPRLYIFTRPYMSPNLPSVTTSTAETSRKPMIIQSRYETLPGASGLSLMPRKMAGREMITMEAFTVASSMPSVVLDSAIHL
jgi:hypothetical protein